VILAGILVSALGFFTMGMAQSLWQVALGFGVLLGTATSAWVVYLQHAAHSHFLKTG
jgi:hypothetical protein